MTFPLTPATPFVAFVTVITSSFLNSVRICINQSLDGTGGSGGNPYTPSTVLAVHGAGMDIDPLSGVVRSGKTLEIDNGGTFTTIAGATFTINSSATFAGNTSFVGSTNTVTAGTWGFYVDAYQLGGSTFHVGDTALGVGHLVVDGRGSGAGSDITFKGVGGATWDASSTATWLANSVASMAGAWTQTSAGTYTQQGTFTKSGAGAVTVERLTTCDPNAAPAGDLTLADPRAFDTYSLISGGNIGLGLPGGAPLGTRVRFYISATRSGVVVDFWNGTIGPAPNKIIRMNPSAVTPISVPFPCFFVDFELVSGPAWEACAAAGPFSAIP